MCLIDKVSERYKWQVAEGFRRKFTKEEEEVMETPSRIPSRNSRRVNKVQGWVRGLTEVGKSKDWIVLSTKYFRVGPVHGRLFNYLKSNREDIEDLCPTNIRSSKNRRRLLVTWTASRLKTSEWVYPRRCGDEIGVFLILDRSYKKGVVG